MWYILFIMHIGLIPFTYTIIIMGICINMRATVSLTARMHEVHVYLLMAIAYVHNK